MDFFGRLEAIAASRDSALCIGLDPSFSRDEKLAEGNEACAIRALDVNRKIIEATAPFAVCFKPNMAFYEALGAPGFECLEKTIAGIPDGIPVLLDVKRGDIDSTAAAYAESSFGIFGADAVTLSPYMGKDSVTPFLEWKEKGVFLLCKTSNPGAGIFQDLVFENEPLYVRVAKECTSWSDRVGLVVAGNVPDALRAVRAAAGRAWLLAPGIGAQGGKADEAMRAGARDDGSGILVVAARSVAGAADPGAAALSLRDTMRRARDAALAAKVAKMPPQNRRSTRQAPSPDRQVKIQHQAESSTSIKTAFANALLDTGCFRLGDFVLKSGAHSPFYIDLRKLVSDPTALRMAAIAYARLAAGCVFDRLAGIPAAGLPLATATSLEMSVPMIWPRMPVKEHGTGNRIEGEFAKGEKVLLLDDLITTGASKLEALEILRKEGLKVSDLIVLIERGAQGRKDMAEAGVKLHAFLHIKELFEVCEERKLIDSERRRELEAFVDAE
jgi:uridine monophosphate synthetase